jgi:hypothetical protein
VAAVVVRDEAGGVLLGVQGVLCRHGCYGDLCRDMPAVCLRAGREVGIIIAFRDERDEQ